MKWITHGERVLYDSEWVRLVLTDVEVPGGPRFDHHVVRMPYFAAGTVVHDAERGLLLIYRHRFITDTWGWEIPAGGIDPGRDPRGGRGPRDPGGDRAGGPGRSRRSSPTSRRTGSPTSASTSSSPTVPRYVGEPSDPGEAERIEWVPLDDVRALIRAGEMVDGLSLTSVLYALQFALR